MADYPEYITGPASAYGLDPNMLARFAQIESGGNPSARTGSYRGLFQLGPEEWAANGSGNIYNPNDNAAAAARKMAAEGEAFRAQYGRAPTPTDYYLLHQQGAGGYGAHLTNPDAPAWQNMYSTEEGRKKGAGWAKQAIWGNVPDDLKPQYGSPDNLTSQQFIDLWRSKVEGGALSLPQGRPTMAADPALSASFMTGGRGSLFGRALGMDAGDASDIKNSLQSAAGWMMALDQPTALNAALQPRDDYSIVTGADGSMYRVQKHSGQVLRVAGPQMKLVDVGTDIGGNPIKKVQIGNSLLPISAMMGGAPGATASGAAGGVSPIDQDQFLAKGVTPETFNSELKGDEYLAQYAPEVQAYVRAKQEGRLPTTANARKGFTATADRAAAKYGEDIGIPMDAAMFAQRRTMRTSLGNTSSNSSLGAQRGAVNTMLQQSEDLAKAYDKLDNVGFPGAIFNAPTNYVGHLVGGAPSIDDFNNTISALAEEATRLARGNGGAEADIQRIIKNISHNSSPQQFYSGLQSLVRTVLNRAGESEASIRETLGERGVQEFPMIRPEGHKALQGFQKRHYAVTGEGPASALSSRPRILSIEPAQ